MKVADTNGDKSWNHEVSVKVADTNHENLRHKSWKLATWFVLRIFMICVRDKTVTLSGTCPGLCRKVGVIEFGLKPVKINIVQFSQICFIHEWSVIPLYWQIFIGHGPKKYRTSNKNIVFYRTHIFSISFSFSFSVSVSVFSMYISAMSSIWHHECTNCVASIYLTVKFCWLREQRDDMIYFSVMIRPLNIVGPQNTSPPFLHLDGLQRVAWAAVWALPKYRIYRTFSQNVR